MLFVHNRAEKTDFVRVIEAEHISAYLLQLISINSITKHDKIPASRNRYQSHWTIDKPTHPIHMDCIEEKKWKKNNIEQMLTTHVQDEIIMFDFSLPLMLVLQVNQPWTKYI